MLHAPQLVTAYDRGHFRKNFWRETHASFENASGFRQKFFLKRPLLRAVAHHHDRGGEIATDTGAAAVKLTIRKTRLGFS